MHNAGKSIIMMECGNYLSRLSFPNNISLLNLVPALLAVSSVLKLERVSLTQLSSCVFVPVGIFQYQHISMSLALLYVRVLSPHSFLWMSYN